MATARLLRIYLQDHHAGAVAGVNVAKRAAGQNEETEYGPELAALAAEIERDKEALEKTMDEVGVGPDPLKDRGAWVAERVGRLKPNARLRDYSPLSRLLELEGLVAGVTAKLALWRSLERVVSEPRSGIDFAALAARAEDQRSRLEALRIRAAEEALVQD